MRDKRKILMLLTNAFRPDMRVKREAKVLAKQGQSVNIICWDRQVEYPSHEIIDGFQINRIHSVPSVYGAGWSQLRHLLKYWNEVIILAKEYKPDVIHCHDLDTLYAGVKLKKKLGCKLIYDAHENYPALMSLHLPKILVFLLTQWEKWLIKFVDATITASTVLRDEYLTQGITPVITLGNFQDMELFTSVKEEEIKAVRTKLGLSSGIISIAYIGGFSRNRLLLPFIGAATLLPEVHFHIWGDGHQRIDVKNAIDNHKNIFYHGWLSPNDLPLYFKSMDIIYYCLRLDYPGAIYNAPNTLTQAMAAERPIIANEVGDLGRMVRSSGCGVLLDEVNATTIAEAIQQLKDPDIRQKIGKKGFQAAKNVYNSQSINRQLIEIYDRLFIHLIIGRK